MKNLAAVLLFVSGLHCFSREIISTNCSTGCVRYTMEHRSPQLLVIEYPLCVLPHLISTPVYRIIENKTSVLAVFYFRGRATLDIFYEKELASVWQYPPHVEEGIRIRSVGCVGNRVVWTDTMTDWAVIPDFTVQFVAFSSFGIVLTLLLKIYCSVDNVLGKPGHSAVDTS